MKSLVLVFMTVICLVVSQSPPCSRLESVDISLGIDYGNGSRIFEGVEYVKGAWYTIEENGRTVVLGCPCIGRFCLWKCCGVDQTLGGKDCNNTILPEKDQFNPPVYDGTTPVNVTANEHFFMMHNNNLCRHRYLVESGFNDEEVFVQLNGTLLISGVDFVHPAATFCVDQMVTEDGPHLVAAVCFFDEDQVSENDDPLVLSITYAVGLYLSTLFLIATFLVYACIPELRNLHGLCLMAYCSGLIVAYPLLAGLKIGMSKIAVTMTGCYLLGFFLYFAFQTSFFWLNVMCFDIWRTFSGYRGGSGRRRTELRRFLLYGTYAWGIPILLTAFLIFMQFFDGLSPAVYRPGFGTMRCWFPDWKSEALYFWLPVLVLVVSNIVLFAVTACRIRAIKQETAILKSSESARSDRMIKDKQRYVLYLKLFMVMGVNWVVELLGFVVGGSNWYWVFLDLSNIMLGLFIFLIFVWKNKVRMLVIKKWRQMRGAPAVVDSTRSTTLPTEDTRVSQDDSAIRLKEIH